MQFAPFLELYLAPAASDGSKLPENSPCPIGTPQTWGTLLSLNTLWFLLYSYFFRWKTSIKFNKVTL